LYDGDLLLCARLRLVPDCGDALLDDDDDDELLDGAVDDDECASRCMVLNIGMSGSEMSAV
jgi:hypothetical protein